MSGPTAPTAPTAIAGQRVIAGPDKLRSELLWRIEDSSGARYVVAQLLPELADDEALRRRYVHDAERRAALTGDGVAAIVAIGPEPDPRDPAAAAPWRLRVDPGGETLADLLAARAPLPVDEALELLAAIADVVADLHDQGAVLRDLEPKHVAVTDGGVVLTDVGLARLHVLSSRTASSLMLESSPYAAPEHLRATVIDRRADVYTLGAIAWHALTGAPPWSDSSSIFREHTPLPTLASMGIEAPNGLDDGLDGALDDLLAACLAADRERRPEGAREVAGALRGEIDFATLRAESRALVRIVCQACGEPLRAGMRLCLSCGREAVQFSHAAEGEPRFQIQLLKASEDTEFVAGLREFFETVADDVPELNFLTGDTRLYSRAERARLQTIPTTLLSDLDRRTAETLAARLDERGYKVRVVEQQVLVSPGRTRLLVYGGITAAIAGSVAAATGAVGLGLLIAVAGVAGFVGGLVRGARALKVLRKPPMAALRAAPAALPASDPLVARLGALLDPRSGRELAADARERVVEIALLVQRLVDHRAGHGGADIEHIVEWVEPVVALVEREVERIAACDGALDDLDEGDLVRAIAASEARGEGRAARAELYTGLDRLRGLEEQRAGHLQNLLEAAGLMRRITRLGLEVRDEDADERKLLALAEASLES